MEVTRTNFQEVLKELDEVLKNATFLSIDGEFTGLNSGPDAKPFDTPAQYYNKLKYGSMDFLFVQFGLSVFTYDEKIEKYNNRTYNFYVFPRPFNRSGPDCRFLCQASSIVFLASNGFNFNKLFKYGIPYLTAHDEEKISKKMEEMHKIREDGLELIPISSDNKPQIEEICAKIDEFLQTDAEELMIDRCNSYIRRIIYQEARMRWQNKIRFECNDDTRGLIVYKMGTKEEEEKRKAERREKEIMELKEAVGLSALLRKIAESGKLIVGHNMLLDLCHIVHQFFGPLPDSYAEFKSLIHGLFPKLLDTKIIAQSESFKELIPSSILGYMFDTINKSPFTMPDVIPVENRSYSTLQKNYHEAGYDAYITGLCFIAMSNYLGSLQSEKISLVDPSSPLLNPFLNKLIIVRLRDYPYIHLVENDPNPNRDHVFHITFPSAWKTSDITHLFSPFGGVLVSWLNDTSAYVGLNRREQSLGLIKKLKKSGALNKIKIQPYASYQLSLEQHQQKPIKPIEGDRKRKHPSTEIKIGNINQAWLGIR
ncbi:hypothetical protein PV326_005374 [Microctonus aethiopoides]|nr:hypothetical protein PV326_005374 [Microctonus aethiopoides]